MSPQCLPQDHPPVSRGHIGVLLINLGTPEAATAPALRTYLKEFLSDRRVIETPRWLWWPLLNGIILNTRPKKSARAYAKIWNRERGESPLKTITRAQAEGVAGLLGSRFSDLHVDWAMRYGHPKLSEKIDALRAKGCDRILLFPLYPQYCAATTATVYDHAFDHLKTLRWQPTIRSVPPYYDHPAYIEALGKSVNAHLSSLPWTPEKILLSFHGLPADYFAKGDPYHCHCQKTARLLREHLGWETDQVQVAFQSRFGKAQWLTPYTDDVVAQWGRDGVKKLLVLTPGFAADCVETLEEIAMETRKVFEEHGGEAFSIVPCLNASTEGLAMLARLVEQELQGWVG